eukprot:scaffold15942_cov78-Cyclotella_meneghiniana.AAC.6
MMAKAVKAIMVGQRQKGSSTIATWCLLLQIQPLYTLRSESGATGNQRYYRPTYGSAIMEGEPA